MFVRRLSALIILYIIAIDAQQVNAGRAGFSTGHGIGLAIGGPALAGIVYRKFFDNRLGLQTSALALPSPPYFDIFCGAHLLYTINDNAERIRFYALIGSVVLVESLARFSLFPGAGCGVEIFSQNKKLSLALQFALAPLIHVNHPQHLLGLMPFPALGLVLTYFV